MQRAFALGEPPAQRRLHLPPSARATRLISHNTPTTAANTIDERPRLLVRRKAPPIRTTLPPHKPNYAAPVS